MSNEIEVVDLIGASSSPSQDNILDPVHFVTSPRRITAPMQGLIIDSMFGDDEEGGDRNREVVRKNDPSDDLIVLDDDESGDDESDDEILKMVQVRRNHEATAARNQPIVLDGATPNNRTIVLDGASPSTPIAVLGPSTPNNRAIVLDNDTPNSRTFSLDTASPNNATIVLSDGTPTNRPIVLSDGTVLSADTPDGTISPFLAANPHSLLFSGNPAQASSSTQPFSRAGPSSSGGARQVHDELVQLLGYESDISPQPYSRENARERPNYDSQDSDGDYDPIEDIAINSVTERMRPPDHSDGYIEPSLYQGPAEDRGSIGGSDKVTDQKVIELLNLNKLSSDASEEKPTPFEMSVRLLKHQRQALAWMCRCEEDNKPPGTPRGGILADDQGFGKTLSVIALLLTNRPKKAEGETKEPNWGTLIVTPTSIMRQWAGELEQRIAPEFRPKVLIYHGSSRPRNPQVLVEKYDIVITSYGMLKQEYPKVIARDAERHPLRRRKKGPLYKVKWFRVVLDEAQAIKNHRAEAFRSVLEIETDRRWSVTGTPIQNTVDDIYSQFVWLRYAVAESYRQWVRQYKRPLEGTRRMGMVSTSTAFKRFQVKLGVVLLRRAKSDKIDGKPVINLPKRTVTVAELKFTATERAYYQAQEKRAVQDLVRFGIEPKMVTALVILLRLRQACGHPALCDWGSSRQFEFSDDILDSVDIRMQSRCLFRLLPADVQNRLAIELGPGSEVSQGCPICMDVIESDGIVTKCGHIFCKSDFEAWNENNDTCPTCRTDVSGVLDKMELVEVRQEVHAIARAKEREKTAASKKEEVEVKPKESFRKINLKGGVKREATVSVEQNNKRARMGFASSSKQESISVGGASSSKQENVLVGGASSSKQENVLQADVDSDSGSVENPKSDAEESPTDENAIAEQAKQNKTSTKITFFLEKFKEIYETTDDKVLCFSQWTRMLDLVEQSVQEQGYEFVRLDGQMNPNDRNDAVRVFNTRSQCRIFLISLQAGSTGLNLTAANRVFLLDSWWNPAVEDQAIDRVHRIGQTKDVEVVRVKIENSVEDRILQLQEKKREIIEGALGVEGLKTLGRRRLTFQDVMGLFQDVAQNVAERARNTQDNNLAEMASQLYMEGQGQSTVDDALAW